ncbi:NAD(P)-dependent oxidoreductase [Aquabacter spiritensis]|uniref:3-hydroxyisobutyrate dehydrogenase n=1 Tax=Aquabacter spiritensis TaxID=933073 RepID=A0A4R3LWU2_9HYPH|nr:NAD(P)-dependent oxidoreductase [Aquabacter spiritensis]TCT05062.1 3-hydroxyisobutyrate dehydrogenase [Aquabacter spiritensis]
MSGGAKPRIGFIGIGAMGWPMAACLLKAGYEVLPFDARPEQVEAFLAEVGGTRVGSLAALGAASDVVITILPTSKVVETVLFGPDGVASGLRAGAVVIDMTSGVPDQTVRFAEALEGQGAALFDAPVSGGVARAATGELTIMAGGPDALIEAAMPVLLTMGAVIRTGGLGSGHAMKALNNLVSAGGFLIGIEALLIGARFGLDPETMVDILNVSTGVNNSTQKKFKQFVLSRSFDSGFPIELMVKDLTTAMEVARSGGVNAPFSGLCRDLWAGAAAMLGPRADHTAVARLSETLAGSTLESKT